MHFTRLVVIRSCIIADHTRHGEVMEVAKIMYMHVQKAALLGAKAVRIRGTQYVIGRHVIHRSSYRSRSSLSSSRSVISHHPVIGLNASVAPVAVIIGLNGHRSWKSFIGHHRSSSVIIGRHHPVSSVIHRRSSSRGMFGHR
jgi:hypothetical protein